MGKEEIECVLCKTYSHPVLVARGACERSWFLVSYIYMYIHVKEPFLEFVTYHLEQDNEKDLLHFLERYTQKLVSNLQCQRKTARMS